MSPSVRYLHKVRLTPELEAAARKALGRLLTPRGRLRRRPLRDALAEATGERTTQGRALTVRIVVRRERNYYVAESEHLGAKSGAATRREAIRRATSASLVVIANRLMEHEVDTPHSITFEVVPAKKRTGARKR